MQLQRDPDAGKYRTLFALEYRIAALVLRPYDGILSWSTQDYVAFVYASERVRLLFYPHKTTRGNRLIRVRDEGSKDPALARDLMMRLRIGNGYCNSFLTKHHATYGDELMLAHREGLRHGWAREQATV